MLWFARVTSRIPVILRCSRTFSATTTIMSDGASQAKKPRHFDALSPNRESRLAIKQCIGQLNYDALHGLCLCKIETSNGNYAASFSDAFCPVNLAADCFAFSSFFQTGMVMVQEFLKDPGFIEQLTDSEKCALKRLFQTINDLEGIEENLGTMKDNETRWVILLVHHLLTRLSVKQNYTVDYSWRDRLDDCKSGGEPLQPKYGDVSMGNMGVWHGCTDILLGGSGSNATVAVKVADLNEDADIINNSSFEIEDNVTIGKQLQQLYAESIVFALLRMQMQQNPAQNFLIPTICISRKEVMICLYDAKLDFLLRSVQTLDLFDKNDPSKLKLSTILTLWLTINYPVTCTGLTDKVTATGYTADFFKSFKQETKDTYKNMLHFKCCRPRNREVEFGEKRNMIIGGKPFEGHYELLEKGK